MISPNEIAALWSKYADGLGMLIRARCASRTDDIVQEAFIRLSRQTILPDDPLAWLARTARNLAIDLVRQERRRKQREERYVEVQGHWLEPETVLGISSDELTRALQLLSCQEHEILVAHIWNGMSFRQIGDVFQLSSSTANRHYQQALEKLRRALEVPSEREIPNTGSSKL